MGHNIQDLKVGDEIEVIYESSDRVYGSGYGIYFKVGHRGLVVSVHEDYVRFLRSDNQGTYSAHYEEVQRVVHHPLRAVFQ